MLPIHILVAISIVHWVADFIVQDHEDAVNKWQKTRSLTNHAFTYTITMFMGMCIALSVFIAVPAFGYKVAPPVGVMAIFVLVWSLLNGVLHWVTDYFTSKHVHRLFQAAPFRRTKYKDAFIVVGLDQVIHLLTLTITWLILPVDQLVTGYH